MTGSVFKWAMLSSPSCPQPHAGDRPRSLPPVDGAHIPLEEEPALPPAGYAREMAATGRRAARTRKREAARALGGRPPSGVAAGRGAGHEGREDGRCLALGVLQGHRRAARGDPRPPWSPARASPWPSPSPRRGPDGGREASRPPPSGHARRRCTRPTCQAHRRCGRRRPMPSRRVAHRPPWSPPPWSRPSWSRPKWRRPQRWRRTRPDPPRLDRRLRARSGTFDRRCRAVGGLGGQHLLRRGAQGSGGFACGHHAGERLRDGAAERLSRCSPRRWCRC